MNTMSAEEIKSIPEVLKLDGVINTYVHSHGSETYKEIQRLFWDAINAIQKTVLSSTPAGEDVEAEAADIDKIIREELEYLKIGDVPYTSVIHQGKTSLIAGKIAYRYKSALQNKVPVECYSEDQLFKMATNVAEWACTNHKEAGKQTMPEWREWYKEYFLKPFKTTLPNTTIK